MPKAHKLPSGRWRVQPSITVNGETVRESITADTKREAEYLAAQWLSSANIERGKSEVITVQDAAERFIHNRENILAVDTVREYSRILATYMNGIKKMNAFNVRSEDMQAAINVESAHLSPKSVRNIYAFFSSAIKSVCPDKSFRVILPQKVKTVYHDAEDEDVHKLIAATHGKHIQTAIAIASFTGMRRSEIAALKTEDIDAAECVIHVQRAIVYGKDKKWHEKSTKNTESERDIDISEPQLKYILSHASKGKYLVGILPSTITNQYIIYRDKLGLKIRYHDLRSYNVSVMHALGIPDKYIIKRTGHSSPFIMNRVYNRATKKRVKDAAKVTEERFNGLIAHENAHEE
jgi:integrase